MSSWNLRVSFSKKTKPHTALCMLCFAFFQTPVRGCGNGRPLWGGHAESRCCRHEAWWAECLFISFSVFCTQTFSLFSESTISYASNLWRQGKICVRKAWGSIWVIPELTWILMLTSVGCLLYPGPGPYLPMFSALVIIGYYYHNDKF